jgi:amino acid adenylation domain-containing protein/non-ribosomal peptide synthase protein (TIGR01720 family)
MSEFLLKRCWKKGIRLSLVDGNLSFKAPDGIVTPDVLADLKENKSSLISVLENNDHLYETRPLSDNERALWFLYQLRPQSVAYNMAYAIKLKKTYSHQQIEHAFNELCKAHPILALNYGEFDGEPFQHLKGLSPVKVVYEELTQQSDKQVKVWLEKQADTLLMPDKNRTCHVALLHHHLKAKQDNDNEETVEKGTECYLSMVIHHIAADFISFEILRRDFMCLLNGQSLNQKEFPAHDYQTWAQRQFNKTYQAEESYWLEALKDLPQLQLPTDFNYQDNLLSVGGEIQASLPAHLSSQIKAQCKAQNVTPYLWWLGAFQWFMARLSGQTEFIIGTPSAGRLRPEDVELVGYLVNPLALHCHVNPAQTFTDWLSAVKDNILQVLTHQAYPFAKLIDKLHIDRDTTRSPIFQHMFTLNSATEDVLVNELVDTEILTDQRGAAHELNLVVVDEKDSFTCKWRFNKNLYKDDTVKTLQHMLTYWISQLVENPSLTLQTVETAPVELLSSMKGPLVSSPSSPPTAWHAFSSQVIQCAHQVAISHQSRQHTYGELAEKIEQAAKVLNHRGFSQGDRLGILLPRSIEQVIAALASWRLGGSFLILDCEWPTSRVKYLCEDADLKCVVADTKALEQYETELVFNEHKGLSPEQLLEKSEIPFLDAQLPNINIQADDEAYLIYTSGSSGKPKAVTVSQGNLNNYVTGLFEHVSLSNRASMTSLSKHSADLGYTSLFGALLTGRQFVVIDEALSLDSKALLTELIERPVDCLKIVPSHLNGLLLAENNAALLPVQALIFGGEAISPHVVNKVNQFKRQDNELLRLYNHYGPTETTIGALIYTISDNESGINGAIPIGKPLANGEIKIVDNSNHVQALGLAGELHISGPNVVKGYVDHSTADNISTYGKFYVEQGKTWYKTGDKAYCIDNNIYYLGRFDDQIKIRGYRVELGEIELWLKKYIDDVAVVAIHGQSDTAQNNGQQHLRLTAFLVTDEETLTQLKQDIQGVLPDYMVPANWLLLDALPRLANGKVDKKALQLLSLDTKTQETAVISSQYSEQQRELAQTLLEIWRTLLNRSDLTADDDFFAAGGDSILGLQVIAKARVADITIKPQQLFQHKTINALVTAITPVPSKQECDLLDIVRTLLNNQNIGPHDDFFSMGGDSILSLQLVAKARQAKIELSPKLVFEHKTVANLVKALDLVSGESVVNGSSQPASFTSSLTGSLTASRKAKQRLPTESFSLTPIQHWFFEQKLVANGHWNQSILLEAKHALNLSSLTKAVQALLMQHATLRLTFEQTDGHWQQCYQTYQSGWENQVVQCCNEALSEQQLAKYQSQLTLSAAPLIRFVYFSKSDALLCTAHHLIVDAVSWQILVEDLLSVYQQQEQNLSGQITPSLSESPSEFYQWQAYLTSLISKENQEQSVTTQLVDYWQMQLMPITAIEKTFDNSYQESTHNITRFNLVTTTSLTHTVNDAYNTRTQELLITALAQTLLKHWEVSDITIELEGHGRESSILTQDSTLDLSRTIGWFTSRFPQRFTQTPSLTSDIIQYKEQLRNVPDKGASYGVVRYLNANEKTVNLSKNEPWGQSNLVSFNYLGNRRTEIDENFSLAKGLVKHSRANNNQRPHLLDVNAMIVDGQLVIDWCYAKSHKRFAEIEQLIQLFSVNVHAIISHCMAPNVGRPTASDFPLAALTETTFVELLNELVASPEPQDLSSLANFSDVSRQQEQD